MTTLREKALEAYRAEWEVASERTSTDEARKRRRKAQTTLKRSPLSKWFPGVEWRFVDFASLGSGELGDGTDVVVTPDDSSVYLLLQRDGDKVFAVEHRRGAGFNHWGGPEVQSAAEVGQAIAERERRR